MSVPCDDLSEQSLSGVYLRGADLGQADLRNVDLLRADLRGADLREAQLGGAVLTDALYDERTLWPEGFRPCSHGALLALDAYQDGVRFSLAPAAGSACFTIVLGSGVRLGRGTTGDALLYRDGEQYGRDLMCALSAGWCRILER